jgi:hypothetical protein
MKNFIEILFVTMFFGLILAGCSKEESGNYLQVGDTTIVLSDGNLKYFGPTSATTYNFDIDLVSPEIVLSSNSGVPIYTGKGSRICFEIFTTGKTSPGNGSYTYDAYSNSVDKTFDYCYYSFDYTATDIYSSIYVESGTLNLKSTTSGYEINFSGTDHIGKRVKIHYVGALTYYNRTGAKK